MQPTNFDLEAIIPIARMSNFEIYVIAKHSARFKTLDLGDLTEEQRAERLVNYSRAHRLVHVIETSNCMRELCISPRAQFAEALKNCEGLTIGDKKITQVHVLTEEEYEDFTAKALATVETSSKAENSKIEEEKSPAARQVPSKASVRSAFSPSKLLFIKSIELVQECFHKAIMTVLNEMYEEQRRLAELAKEKSKEKRELHKLITALYNQTADLAFDIKVTEIQKTYFKQFQTA